MMTKFPWIVSWHYFPLFQNIAEEMSGSAFLLDVRARCSLGKKCKVTRMISLWQIKGWRGVVRHHLELEQIRPLRLRLSYDGLQQKQHVILNPFCADSNEARHSSSSPGVGWWGSKHKLNSAGRTPCHLAIKTCHIAHSCTRE